MHTLLVSANTEKINMPTLPIGLGCVAAAVTAAGHTADFLDLLGIEDWRAPLREALARRMPDLIGISIRNIDDQTSLNPRFLLEAAREVVAVCQARSQAPVVLGGAGYSIFPESVLDFTGAPMGIQGEGELPMVMLLDRLAAGAPLDDVPGLYLKGKGLQAPRTYTRDLDRFPLPGPELFDARCADDPNYYLPIQTRRGCPLDCSYCSTATIEGGVIRRRSPAAVIEALKRWRAAGFFRIFFVDNIFNLPESYAVELCEGLAAAGLGLNWRAILYPGKITERLAKAMARAGCREVSLGFESGAPPMLDSLHKRFSPEEVAQASRLLADQGIVRMGFLLLGAPGETRDTVMQSLAFADSLHLEAMKVSVGVRIYPYTDLSRTAVREGLIVSEAELLMPRFYIDPGLDEAWLRQTVQAWLADRPNWMT